MWRKTKEKSKVLPTSDMPFLLLDNGFIINKYMTDYTHIKFQGVQLCD